jgi:hypothetical protein
MCYAQFHNIAFFNEKPYFTKGDGDNDFDVYSSTTGIFTNDRDDSDLLQCSITEGTNEAYDAQLPLYLDVNLEDSTNADLAYKTLDFDWKVIYVTGEAKVSCSDDFDTTASSTRVSRWGVKGGEAREGGDIDKGDYIESHIYMQWDFNIDTFFESTASVSSSGRLPTWLTDHLNITVDKSNSNNWPDFRDDIVQFDWTSSGGDPADDMNDFQAVVNSVVDDTEYQYDCATISKTADGTPKMYLVLQTITGFTEPVYDGTTVAVTTGGSVITTTPATPVGGPGLFDDLNQVNALTLAIGAVVAIISIYGFYKIKFVRRLSNAAGALVKKPKGRY